LVGDAARSASEVSAVTLASEAAEGHPGSSEHVWRAAPSAPAQPRAQHDGAGAKGPAQPRDDLQAGAGNAEAVSRAPTGNSSAPSPQHRSEGRNWVLHRSQTLDAIGGRLPKRSEIKCRVRDVSPYPHAYGCHVPPLVTGANRNPLSGMERARTQEQRTANLSPRRRRVTGLQTPPAQPQRNEDEFTRFFVQSLDLLCVAGLDGYFKYLNPAWTAGLGWTLEELKARPFIDFVHPDDRTATQAEVGKLAEGTETILFENRYRHRDGSFRWLQWNARHVTGREQIYATARDVTRQKCLEREILEVVDREKERLGRELHDGLCQSLAGIAALGTTLSKKLAANSESATSAMAAEIVTLLNESITQARDLAHGLGPVGLNEAGLDGALETLALGVRHLFRVTCTFQCDRPFLRPRPEVESHLVRIAQEAVNNAITHGNADRIEIRLGSEGGHGLLCIEDNGVGMPEEAPTPEGVGLHTMAYRARLIGGSLEVRRRTPRGTAVTCAFPLSGTPDAREQPEHVRREN
jgi:PAS domain S-box-containing protein